MASIWITDEAEMEMAKKMLRIPFYLNFLNAINDCVTSFVLTMKFAYTAMVPSLARGITFIVGSLGLYYTRRRDPVRMMWSFCINDLVVLVFDLLISVAPLRGLLLLIKSL
jgi:hypothetical protein